MTILVIEDSRLIRTAVVRILSKAGHQVIAACDGEEGLRRAQEIGPELILLDMMLPTLEGTSVLRHLKKNSVTKSIPVVVLSGLSQKNEQRLKHDGAAAFLPKSLLDLDRDGSELVRALDGIMGTTSAAEADAQTAAMRSGA